MSLSTQNKEFNSIDLLFMDSPLSDCELVEKNIETIYLADTQQNASQVETQFESEKDLDNAWFRKRKLHDHIGYYKKEKPSIQINKCHQNQPNCSSINATHNNELAGYFDDVGKKAICYPENNIVDDGFFNIEDTQIIDLQAMGLNKIQTQGI